MSLINEALKKAQRLRSDDVAEPSAATYGGSTHLPRRGRADHTGTMVLIASGALVLVVLSVVTTAYFVNRPTRPGQGKVADAAVVERPASSPAYSGPVIVTPALTPAAASTTPVDTPIVVPGPARSASATPAAPASAADAVVALPLTPVTPVAPVAAEASIEGVVETPAAPPLPPDAPDERVVTFVESIRVTGIRSSGADSRVLMNERVYRVNDIVERTLNLRLIDASAENLTFADERGVVYVKRF